MGLKIVQRIIDKIRGKKEKNVALDTELPIYSVPYNPPKNMFKTLICPTGFGHSGSGALLDYFAEFDNATTLGFFDNDYSGLVKDFDTKISEIDIFRSAGSVIDLEKNLNSAGYFNDDFSIKLFLHVAEYYYRKGIIYTDYFWYLVNEFVESIVDLKLEKNSGLVGLHFLQLLAQRKKYKNIHSPLLIDYPGEKYIYYLKNLSVKEYREIAKNFIIKFLKSIDSKDFLVCDQMLTVSKCDTEKMVDYFGDFKQIVVYRDPRDVYVTGVTRKDTSWMAKNPQDFIKWWGHRGVPSYIKAKPHPNRLTIRFEDFVLNYDETSKIINDFVGIDEKNHIHKKEYFNPKVSKQNIGLYKTYGKQEEIKYIEEYLKEYCYYGETIK